jgi:hypothetical protein
MQLGLNATQHILILVAEVSVLVAARPRGRRQAQPLRAESDGAQLRHDPLSAEDL